MKCKQLKLQCDSTPSVLYECLVPFNNLKKFVENPHSDVTIQLFQKESSINWEPSDFEHECFARVFKEFEERGYQPNDLVPLTLRLKEYQIKEVKPTYS